MTDILKEVMDVPDTPKEVMDMTDILKEVMDVHDTLMEMIRFALKSHCYRAQHLKRYFFCRLLISAPTPTIPTEVFVDILSPSRCIFHK